MVNETLARYGDWSHGAATAIYLLALVFLLVEYAAWRAKQAAPARELVGAGGPVTVSPATVERIEPRSRAERFGRMGLSLVVLGAGVHLASIALRGFAAGRAPWGNMYEYSSLVCFIAVVTYLALVKFFGVRRIGIFMLTPIVILMFIGGTLLYVQAAPLLPALQSYWLVIHVLAAATSSGVFLVPGIASVLYLIKTHPGRLPGLAQRLPDKDVLDRIAYRVTIIAFPIFTFGVLCGAIWAEAAWSRFWGWDPKETTALVCWVIYAAYLHARATAGWRGTPAAVINTIGLAGTVFNLFFVNLVTAGLHSYSGL